MNAMVAGTMLRGMFEERIQNVIREIRRNARTSFCSSTRRTRMIGAGSALGAPSDAANMLKSRARARRSAHHRRDDVQRVQGIHPGRRGARAPLPYRVTSTSPRIDETRRHPAQAAAAARAQLLGAHRGRRDRDRAGDVTRYMRHLQLPDKAIGWLDTASVKAEIDGRLGRDRERRRVGDLAVSHPRGHGLSRHLGSLPRRRDELCSNASSVRRRPSSAVARRLRAEQGTAQRWIRSAGRRAALPWTDRRRQDGAREGGRRDSCSATSRR